VAGEIVAGSGRNAAITGTNETVYIGLGILGSKFIENITPGQTTDVSCQLKEGIK